MAIKKREEEKRNWGVSFRLNDEEYDTMISRMEEMGIEKKTEFLRTCIMDPVIVNQEYVRKQLADLNFQLRRMDSRLEQIFKNLSVRKNGADINLTKFQFGEIRELLKRTLDFLCQLEDDVKKNIF